MTANRPSIQTDRPPETPRRQSDDGWDDRTTGGLDHRGADESNRTVGEVLDLLGDEYACDIVRALGDGPKAARELAEHCGMSRATAYRRLDRLTDVGVVTTRVGIPLDGNHRRRYRLALDAVELRVGADGIDGSVTEAGRPDG